MDIRSALVRTIRLVRESDNAVRATLNRSQIGPGTDFADADPTEEGPAGYNRPVGSGYNVTVVAKDRADMANVEADAMAQETYRVELDYAGTTGATPRTVNLAGLGFTFIPLEYGTQGQFEGYQINGFAYGDDSDDIVTIGPAIVTA